MPRIYTSLLANGAPLLFQLPFLKQALKKMAISDTVKIEEKVFIQPFFTT
jgi:hypothetical protein